VNDLENPSVTPSSLLLVESPAAATKVCLARARCAQSKLVDGVNEELEMYVYTM